MRINETNRLTVLLAILCIGLLMLSAWFAWNYVTLLIHVKFAQEQTSIFEEMRMKSLKADTVSAADYLQYTVIYYQSGSKQATGSPLDLMVERERAYAVRDIIACLRVKTGEDLGDKPEPWIEKYGKRQ